MEPAGGAAHEHSGWRTFSVLGLVAMAVWTLVIKYLAPVLYLVSERAAGRSLDGAPVMWDFWWVAHLALAWLFWHRHPAAWLAGIGVASVEVVIVSVKFALYMSRPDLSFWKLLWFTNKVYVLLFFILLLVLLLTGRVVSGAGQAQGGIWGGRRGGRRS
jgi:hypothetical protein